MLISMSFLLHYVVTISLLSEKAISNEYTWMKQEVYRQIYVCDAYKYFLLFFDEDKAALWRFERGEKRVSMLGALRSCKYCLQIVISTPH